MNVDVGWFWVFFMNVNIGWFWVILEIEDFDTLMLDEVDLSTSIVCQPYKQGKRVCLV